jgi:hypothetical protein
MSRREHSRSIRPWEKLLLFLDEIMMLVDEKWKVHVYELGKAGRGASTFHKAIRAARLLLELNILGSSMPITPWKCAASFAAAGSTVTLRRSNGSVSLMSRCCVATQGDTLRYLRLLHIGRL